MVYDASARERHVRFSTIRAGIPNNKNNKQHSNCRWQQHSIIFLRFFNGSTQSFSFSSIVNNVSILFAQINYVYVAFNLIVDLLKLSASNVLQGPVVEYKNIVQNFIVYDGIQKLLLKS